MENVANYPQNPILGILMEICKRGKKKSLDSVLVTERRIFATDATSCVSIMIDSIQGLEIKPGLYQLLYKGRNVHFIRAEGGRFPTAEKLESLFPSALGNYYDADFCISKENHQTDTSKTYYNLIRAGCPCFNVEYLADLEGHSGKIHWHYDDQDGGVSHPVYFALPTVGAQMVVQPIIAD